MKSETDEDKRYNLTALGYLLPKGVSLEKGEELEAFLHSWGEDSAVSGDTIFSVNEQGKILKTRLIENRFISEQTTVEVNNLESLSVTNGFLFTVRQGEKGRLVEFAKTSDTFFRFHSALEIDSFFLPVATDYVSNSVESSLEICSAGNIFFWENGEIKSSGSITGYNIKKTWLHPHGILYFRACGKNNTLHILKYIPLTKKGLEIDKVIRPETLYKIEQPESARSREIFFDGRHTFAILEKPNTLALVLTGHNLSETHRFELQQSQSYKDLFIYRGDIFLIREGNIDRYNVRLQV